MNTVLNSFVSIVLFDYILTTLLVYITMKKKKKEVVITLRV